MLSVQLTVAHEPETQSGDRDRPGPAESDPGATAFTEMDPRVTLHLFKEGYDLAAARDSESTAGTGLRAAPCPGLHSVSYYPGTADVVPTGHETS